MESLQSSHRARVSLGKSHAQSELDVTYHKGAVNVVCLSPTLHMQCFRLGRIKKAYALTPYTDPYYNSPIERTRPLPGPCLTLFVRHS